MIYRYIILLLRSQRFIYFICTVLLMPSWAVICLEPGLCWHVDILMESYHIARIIYLSPQFQMLIPILWVSNMTWYGIIAMTETEYKSNLNYKMYPISHPNGRAVECICYELKKIDHVIMAPHYICHWTESCSSLVQVMGCRLAQCCSLSN